MKQKQHSTEDIIRILLQADTDQTVESVCRDHNISKATFHRWKRKYGDMDIADAEETSGSPCGRPEAVLGAEGLSLYRVTPVYLSIYRPTATAQASPTARAYYRSVVAASPLRLSAHPRPVGTRGLDG